MDAVKKNLIISLVFLIFISGSCRKPLKEFDPEVTCKPLEAIPASQINPGLTKNDGNVVFVTLLGCGNGDGSNWADATSESFLHNIAALSASTQDGKKINKIYLSAGYYKPTNDINDPSAAFDVPLSTAAADPIGGVEFVGGFNGDTSEAKKADPVKYKVYFCGRAASTSIDNDCADGDNTNRIFATTNPFKLTNVYIKGGGAAGNGGAINGTTIGLNNVTLIDNSAGGNGGSVNGQDVIVNNSTFKNNRGQTAGAINGKNVTVFNTTFISNTANYGGAIIANNNLMVVNSNFYSNVATAPNNIDSGAAIYLSATSGLKGLIVGSNFIGHAGTPIPTIWSKVNRATVFINNIIYDNGNNIFHPAAAANVDQWAYNSIIKGGFKSSDDVTYIILNTDPKLLDLQTIANAKQNNSYNYLDASSIAINTGARVWVDSTSSSLNNTVYIYNKSGFMKHAYNVTNGSWNSTTSSSFSEAIEGHVELTEFDMLKEYRNLLVDMGTVENK